MGRGFLQDPEDLQASLPFSEVPSGMLLVLGVPLGRVVEVDAVRLQGVPPPSTDISNSRRTPAGPRRCRLDRRGPVRLQTADGRGRAALTPRGIVGGGRRGRWPTPPRRRAPTPTSRRRGEWPLACARTTQRTKKHRIPLRAGPVDMGGQYRQPAKSEAVSYAGILRTWAHRASRSCRRITDPNRNRYRSASL